MYSACSPHPFQSLRRSRERMDMDTKYEQLADILRSELARFRARGMNRLPAERSLALYYHMSRQSVRHALELLESEGLVERRRGSGCYILDAPSLPRSRRVAVLSPFPDEYTFPLLYHDIKARLAQARYETELFSTENQISREREILLSLMDGAFSAVIAEGTRSALPSPNAELYMRLRAMGVPVLFLHGAYTNLEGFSSLSGDNCGGGRLLAQHLLGQGHTRIACICRSDDLQGPQRYQGAASALGAAGFPLPDARTLWCDAHKRAAMLQSADAENPLSTFIRGGLQGASAVICHDDAIAHALILALLRAGLRVPEDVAVVSFDNSYYAAMEPIPLTSLACEKKSAGNCAAALLLDMLHGAPPRSLRLGWKLVQRASG